MDVDIDHALINLANASNRDQFENEVNKLPFEVRGDFLRPNIVDKIFSWIKDHHQSFNQQDVENLTRLKTQIHKFYHNHACKNSDIQERVQCIFLTVLSTLESDEREELLDIITNRNLRRYLLKTLIIIPDKLRNEAIAKFLVDMFVTFKKMGDIEEIYQIADGTSCILGKKVLEILKPYLQYEIYFEEFVTMVKVSIILSAYHDENERTRELSCLVQTAFNKSYINTAKLLLDNIRIDLEGFFAKDYWKIPYFIKILELADDTKPAEMISEPALNQIKTLHSKKMLAHRFSISGTDELSRPYTGYSSILTYPILTSSIQQYLLNNQDIHNLDENEQQEIIDAFAMNNVGIKFKKQCCRYENKKLVIIPTGWGNHTTSLVIKDRILLKGNKGEFRKDFGLLLYKINSPQFITPNFIKLLSILFHQNNRKEQTFFYFNHQINEDLGLEFNPAESLKTHGQKAGNCSWASAKLAFRGALYLTYLGKDYEPKNAKEMTEKVFKDWRRFDLKLGISDYLDEHKEGGPLHSLMDKKLLRLIYDKSAGKKEKVYQEVQEKIKSLNDLSIQI